VWGTITARSLRGSAGTDGRRPDQPTGWKRPEARDEEATRGSLFWRIFLLNAAVLVVATVVLLLGPATVSTPAVIREAVVLAAGLAAMLAANAARLLPDLRILILTMHDNEQSTALIRNYLDRAAAGDLIPARAITDREEKILKLVAEGHSSKEIADMLFISVKTVERHRANLLAKLGLRDRLELTRYAIRAGLIEP